MKVIYFTVTGRPAPQGSKRHVGNGRMLEMSKHVEPWREAVRATAVKEMTASGWSRITGAVRVSMTFYFDRPKSHYLAGKNAHLLRDDAPMYPASIPDLSKLIRSTEDAMTSAAVWEDDARVIEVVARKEYTCAPEDLEARQGRLSVPGATIRVYGVA